jgi:LmbE family N-acetylglucosaminyl deacetylase
MLLLAIILVLGVPLYFILRTSLTAPANEALAVGHLLVRSKRVLVVVAHPDDAEWWAAGTLALIHKNGGKVCLVVASDGDKGPNKVMAKDLAATRRGEQREAGRILGYSRIEFFGLPDRSVIRSPILPREIMRIWREFEPDTVVTFDGSMPALPYLHPDHEALGKLVTRLWETHMAELPMLFLFHSRRPNAAVDISEVIEQKVDAMLAHKSQAGANRKAFVARANRSTGSKVNLPYAELFRKFEKP